MNIVFCLHDELNASDFESKLVKLKTNYNMISYNDFVHLFNSKGLDRSQNNCLLTFDDGWRSTYEIVFPLLKKHNVPALIFVSAEYIEKGKSFWFQETCLLNNEKLTEYLIDTNIFLEGARAFPLDLLLKELKYRVRENIISDFCNNNQIERLQKSLITVNEMYEMEQSGLIEFGAHTIDHPILKNEDDYTAKKQIQDSVYKLETLLGHKVTAFAYPNGIPDVDFSSREISILKQVGIKFAFSLEPSELTNKVDPFSVPRFTSFRRLIFGSIAKYLPSPYNQKGKREKIRNLLIR